MLRWLLLVTVLAGWTWEHPTPHDGAIAAMTTRGKDLYTVGPRGALFVSRDAATSWRPLASATTADLRAIASDAAVFAVGERGTIVRSRDGVTFEVRSAKTTANLVGVATSAQLVVAVADDGTLVRSLDGGDTFETLAGIKDAAASVSIAPSGVYIAASTGVWRSTDRGTAWKRVTREAAQALASAPDGTVYAASATSFHYPALEICGTCIDAHYERLALYRSSDGVAWSRRTLEDPASTARTWGPPTASPPPPQPPRGSYGGWRGVGAPQPWLVVRTPTLAIGPRGEVFVADGQALHTSTDRGASFATSTGRSGALAVAAGTLHAASDVASQRATSDNLFTIAAAPNGRVYAAGLAGTVLARTPAGTWTKLATPTSSAQRLTAVYAADTHVVVVGDGGVILQSTDGVTFRQRAADRVVDLTSIWGIGDDVYAVGTRTLVRSRDRGKAWETLEAPFAGAYDMWGTAKELYVLADGLYRSTDRGTTWQVTELPGWFSSLWGVDGELLIAGSDGKLARSRDQGRTWRVIPTSTKAELANIWGRGDELYVVGETLLRSSDRGKTWREERVPTTSNLFAITGTTSNAFVLGDRATILREVP